MISCQNIPLWTVEVEVVVRLLRFCDKESRLKGLLSLCQLIKLHFLRSSSLVFISFNARQAKQIWGCPPYWTNNF